MVNIINVAKKELFDIFSSKIVVFSILVYMLIVIGFTYDFYKAVLESTFVRDYFLSNTINVLAFQLYYYGTIIAIVLGYFSITNEYNSNAIRVLMVKPVYRDTIINGKLFAALAFFLVLFLFITILYISLLFILFGDMIGQVFLQFLNGVTVVLFLSLLVMMFFFSISMLISLIFKEQSLGLFISLLLVIVVLILLPNIAVSWYLSLLFGSDQQSVFMMISGLSPRVMMENILSGKSWDFDSVLTHSFDIVKLMLCSLMATVASYIVFIRKDIV